jgi:hypothetical protein
VSFILPWGSDSANYGVRHARFVVLRWRLQAYAISIKDATVRNARTLTLIIGVFVFGLPLNAQLDLLGLPVTVLLTPGQSGLNQALVLAALSVLAVTSVSVQSTTVFGGAARTWTTGLPGGAVAQVMADRLVAAVALWPFWIMLLAVLVQHLMNFGSNMGDWTFAAILIVSPTLWVGVALASAARSRIGLILVVSGNLLLWGSLQHAGVWDLLGLPALICGVLSIRLSTLPTILETSHKRRLRLSRGSIFGLVLGVFAWKYGQSIRLRSLFLFVMLASTLWIVQAPGYESRIWEVANFELPFVLYHMATLHSWMRDEAERQTDWMGSLPKAITRYKRVAFIIVFGVSCLFIVAMAIICGSASNILSSYANAAAVYVCLSIGLAMCRWWGPKRSRLIDILLAVSSAITSFIMFG